MLATSRFEHYSEAFVRKTLAQFYNILMKFRRDLRSPLFLSVTNLMDMLFEISFAGKVCAFMLPFEHVHSCVRFKKNKKQAFGQAFPPQCTPSPPNTHTHPASEGIGRTIF